MKCLNLLPTQIRQRWEWQRQVVTWCVVWGLAALLLWIVYNILETKHWEARQLVENEEAQVLVVAQATAQVQHLQHEAARTQRVVENAQLLELTDLPLGLLQTLIDCCQRQGHGIQLDSIRIDELGVTTIKEGEVTPANKQIVISGLADSDPRATSLINSLKASLLFDVVELLSIQEASGEGHHRTFSIRCEQKL